MKKHIILLLKTLINNNACVEAARTREKKYNIIGPILAVFALFFCALPVCVKGFQVNGQDVVSTAYGTDGGLYAFNRDNQNELSMKITTDANGKHVLDMDDTRWKSNTAAQQQATIRNGKLSGEVTSTELLKDLYRYTYVDELKPSGDKVNWLEIYFTEKTGSEFQEFYVNIANNKNPYDTNQNMRVVTTDGKDTIQSRTTSFIVFGKQEFFIATYSQASTSAVSTMLGDYQNTKVGTDFITSYYDATGQDKTLTNWKVFFNESYINNRFSNTWKQTGINLGINGGVLILMGFVVWLTTRGRNNPFRIYSYWDCQKICFYASFTPGLIGLFGFMSTQLATMLFAMSCGVRVLWLSMRTLKYQAPAK